MTAVPYHPRTVSKSPVIGHTALLHEGMALLLDLSGKGKLRRADEPWAGRVKYVSAKAKDSLA
ncbi:MAG TPA: hypothetical protein VH139_07565 [Acidobacteriaceae bacterium]|nr:hypothetical protein [Acidobacteriaceae bacterium]